MTSINNPLEFELPLVDLEKQLAVLQDEISAGDERKRSEFDKLERKLHKLRQDIYSRLRPYQKVQLSRHFDRPFTLDLIGAMTSDFVELHGDRLFRDDPAIVGGLAKLGTIDVVLLGHQRGRTMAEKLRRNFGMPQPEGFRKARRLFRLAEKFRLPLITLIDTSGAFPGLEAEERGQAEAIAKNLVTLAALRVPIISVVIGEGGSGGALALGVADRILMLENACYSVITPEGCASILWKDGSQTYAAQAAEALQLTAQDLERLKIIEEIIAEPPGGAHRSHQEAAGLLKEALLRNLEELRSKDLAELLEERYQKFRRIGMFTGESN